MSEKVIPINRSSRVKRSSFEPLAQPVWLINHLKKIGALNDAHVAWKAWPTLETATFKLARLLGSSCKTHNGVHIVYDVVPKAITSFKVLSYSGLVLTTSAKGYAAELLNAGEMIAANRFEAAGPDPEGEVSVWDPTLGPFDAWSASLPKNFTIRSIPLDPFPGEYAVGRMLLAALILTTTDYLSLAYPFPGATRGDL